MVVPPHSNRNSLARRLRPWLGLTERDLVVPVYKATIEGEHY
jgi:hypothetical protein